MISINNNFPATPAICINYNDMRDILLRKVNKLMCLGRLGGKSQYLCFVTFIVEVALVELIFFSSTPPPPPMLKVNYI